MGGSHTTIKSIGRSRGVVLNSAMLKALRIDLGLTQEQVAENAGISTRSYQNAENERRVSTQLGHRIGVALGHPYASLVKPRSEEVLERLLEVGYGPLPPPSVWAARAREMELIASVLGEQSRPGVRCCLTGPTGIGKSALAFKVAALLERDFADGVILVTSSRNTNDRDATTTMVHIARALGYEHRLPPRNRVAFEIFRQAFYRGLWERRRLLILDDVTSVEHGRRFLGEEAIGWTLLTTTRRSVAATLGQPKIEIGPLSDDASLELFRAHLGADRVNESSEVARALVHLLGGVPRNLLIASKTLEGEQYTSFGDYAHRVRALEDDINEEQGGRWLKSKDEASFDQAYAQLRQRLDERTWTFFSALSVFEDALFSIRWAAAAGDASVEEAAHHLSVLTDVFLVRDVRLGDVREPAFVLDAQAERVARAIVSENMPRIQRNLCRFALEEARRIGAMEVTAGAQGIASEFQTWRRCFDLMTGLVRPSSAGEIIESPDAISPVEEPLEEPAQLFPETLVAMVKELNLKVYPECGAWLSAALRVAHHGDDRLRFGHLSAALGRWWVMNLMGFEQMESFGRVASEAFQKERANEAAYSAQFYSSSGQLSGRGPAVSIPSFERCLELTKETELDPRYRAQALHSFACVLGPYAKSRDHWDRAVVSCEQALDHCSQKTFQERAQHAAIFVSLAVLRALEAAPLPEGDLGAALEVLLEIVGDDQLEQWRLECVGSFLGLSRWEGQEIMTPKRQQEIFLSVAPEAVPRRFVKLFELVYNRAGHPSGFYDPVKIEATVRPFARGRTALAELILGTPLELELGHLLGVLYPASILNELLDDRGVSLVRDFVVKTAGAEHPVMGMIDFLDASISRESKE